MPLLLDLNESIRALSRMDPQPNGGQGLVLPYSAVLDLARGLDRQRGRLHGSNVARVELAALTLGIPPERYLRNGSAYSLAEQARL
ncbi:MAG: hypothetical protein Q7I92_14705, partial [Humidesulfovibrio sp.]|nr:hypothetical protein [Humidesulfovibrio sp.]